MNIKKKTSTPLVGTFILLFVFTWIYLDRKIREDWCLKAMLAGPIAPNNPDLLELIRNKFMIEPSKKSYNLLGEKNEANKGIEDSEKLYSKVTNILFKDKREGVFVEAGALDGETMSNTLMLEVNQSWTGILIEPDTVSFTALTSKNRKAWLAKVALSPEPYPLQRLFSVAPQFVDKLSGYLPYGFKMRAMNGLPDYIGPRNDQFQWHFYVQCFPLESLLRAVEIYKVDLLSLDVEGPEIGILKNFPFDKFDVQVIYLETKVTANFAVIKDYLASKGYDMYTHLREDSVFIKKGSPYCNRSN